ncbi:efflux ABC transporter, permease protein [Marvinbryantia formatexigens DSM 14469]|uniref:Efflux ABC transporter, permease protein n=2 Tax=Marvinbryantia TaxID=248744 RepID=C6LID9_9FIRM|nr:efflux ABC transporter, permease protein [Marvinbryantia formatexigens DSM 14469]SDG10271.1 FtsX-like permease family protein [Marvinbryantia formatexigens]
MVMKKTRRKHLMRTIRKNGVSFFAVGFIAAVSIAIFLGFQSTADAILKKANRYFTENRLETLEISCANGITQEDIEAVAGWDGVDAVEGGYSAMILMDGSDEKVTLQALSLCSEMNDPVVLEGELPAAENEAAIEEKFAEEKGLQVGDEFTVSHDGSLVSDTFHVTSIINDPRYSCANVIDSRGKSTEGLGAASYYIELSREAFDTSYYEDCFSAAYVQNDSLGEIYYFSDQYAQEEAAFAEKTEELGAERAELRYTSLREEADTAIADAQAEIADGQAEIDDGQSDIAEAENELADAEAEIADTEEELELALAEIEAQLTNLGISTDLDEALEQMEALGEAALPLKNAVTEYQDGVRQLEEAKTEFTASQEELADARLELADAQEKLADAQAELADAQEEAADIQMKDWIVADRHEIGDVRGVETLVEGIYGLSYSMSVIFLLVAIIVCHAAITRMIDEQRALIGAQKALGFQSGEILTHYMLYNTLSGLLGVLIGYAASVGIVEVIVLYIYAPEFLIGSIPFGFEWKSALVSAVICLIVFWAATYMACAKLVRLPATTLLRGEVPVQGKKRFFENWKCYKRMNLYSRTMIKNVLNDKGRMATTIMGVVGCISLLVICFSLKFAIADSSVWQFDKYFLYDNRLVFDSSTGSAEEFEKILDEEGISYTLVQDKLENFRVDGGNWENGRIVAVDDAEELKDFMVLEDIKTKEVVDVPQDGLLVSRRCAEEYGLEAGSTVEFMDSEGGIREFKIAGVMEHYLSYHLFGTSGSYFEETMGEATDACVFLLNGDIDGLYERVKDIDGFLSLKDNSEFTANSAVIDPVIGICLLLSAVMALLVLLNQIAMYINRKARELAVMRINGYTLKETKAYVYKDNIVLTILGLLLGSGFGLALAYVVIRAVETGAIHYVRTPNIPACLYACAVGAFFALIVNLIALRKVKQLNLTNVSSN